FLPVLSQARRPAGEAAVGPGAWAADFLLFPREFAPRLHDFYVGLCRSAGFEPKQGRESSRTRWMLGTWDAATTALFPASVTLDLPDSVAAVAISAPRGRLETQLMWRTGDHSPALLALLAVAAGVFVAVPA